MGIAKQGSGVSIHWRMLLDLEQDLLDVSRYIEFDPANYDVYSARLASLLLSACSEVDVVAKMLCHQLKASAARRHIGDYANVIGSRIKPLASFEVRIPRHGLTLHPWTNWAQNPRKSPLWWQCHNNVKHERNRYFHQATLGNLLNAVSGLYVLLLYLNKPAAAAGELGPNPMLLRPAESCIAGTVFNDVEFVWEYALGS